MSRKSVLTTGEAAKYCNVNFRTVIRWIERGHLKAYKLPGRGDNRIQVEDFIGFLEQSGMPVPNELRGDLNVQGDATSQDAEHSGSLPNKGTNDILIVDDERAMAAAIERVLIRQGYQTHIACDGFQAGIFLNQFKPALITLDLQMPSLDGFAVLDFIQRQKIEVKVLVISGMTEPMLLKSLAHGANDYLAKPYDNAVLLEKVASLIQS